VTIKVPYNYGQVLYLNTDPEQLPHELVGIVAGPGFIKYKLSFNGEECDVFDFQTSKEKNPAIMLGFETKDEV
jgi:hypothetical protein